MKKFALFLICIVLLCGCSKYSKEQAYLIENGYDCNCDIFDCELEEINIEEETNITYRKIYAFNFRQKYFVYGDGMKGIDDEYYVYEWEYYYQFGDFKKTESYAGEATVNMNSGFNANPTYHYYCNEDKLKVTENNSDSSKMDCNDIEDVTYKEYCIKGKEYCTLGYNIYLEQKGE